MDNVNLAATRPRDEALGPSAGKLSLHQLTVKYKAYGCPPDKSRKRRPSELVREKLDKPIPYRDGQNRIKPTIVERHNFFNLPYQVPSSVKVEEPLFQPFPPQITFTGYKAFNKYHAILQLRNNDKLVRRVMVIPLVSEILTVQPYSFPDLKQRTIYDDLGVSKIACGMEFSVIVNFCPQDENDHESEVVVVTEREKFTVPVVCHGLRGVLDIADEIHFPPTPVQYNYKKNVMIQNPGTKLANFAVRTYIEQEDGRQVEEIFFVVPEDGKLEPGEFIELCVEFKPIKVGFIEAELEIKYVDSNEYVYSRLTGSGTELEVGLSTDTLTMKPTYFKTTSEFSIYIYNYSTEVAVFQFERFATREEEIDFSSGAPIAAFNWALKASEASTLLQDEDKDAPTKGKIFTLNPAKGDLWPGQRLEVIITFNPQQARRYYAIAYCTISGKQDRLPLRLDGLGVGPLAQFFPTKVDLKDLHLFSVYNFEAHLRNTGELKAYFKLESSKSEMLGTRFKFDPETGCVAVGEIQKIKVNLFLDKRVYFQEMFTWLIESSVNTAPLYFRGNIVKPAIDVEPRLLDFGLISFGFDCVQELRITNRSAVSLNFKLKLTEMEISFHCKIHGDVKSEKPCFMCALHEGETDFSIIPDSIIVMPKETVIIVLKLVPKEERKYEGILSVYLEEIDEEICKVDVKGECFIPKVSLPVDSINFGRCYLRYVYTKPLELLNESNVPAKFMLLSLDVDGRRQANVTSTPMEGIIEAFSLLALDIHFAAEILGDIRLDILFSISGKDPTTLSVTLKAFGVGAELRFVSPSDTSPRSSRSEWEPPSLDFGKVAVLKKHCLVLEVTNISPIAAPVRIFTENFEDSVYSVNISEQTFEPNQVVDLEVIAFLDDTMKFKDVLKFSLEGGEYDIDCSATGYGPLLICEEFEHGFIKFGDVLTYTPLSRTLLIQNLGRRPRALGCFNESFEKDAIFFSLEPAKATLQPKETTTVLVSGMCNESRKIEELLSFTGSVLPAKARGKTETHKVVVSADVAALALIFSANTLKFIQINGPGYPEGDETVETLTCQNVFKQPLHFTFDIKVPYRLTQIEFVLQPRETISVDVILDWQRPRDKLSHTFTSKMDVVYRDTLRRDYINLVAEIHFPNLHIQANKIEFGCVTENTSKRVYLQITNVSIVNVQYCWAFIDKYGTDINTSRECLQQNEDHKIPTNQIFDILPIRAVLLPGESETVEFSYYSFPDYKCRAIALCEVELGPSYSVVLEGESSAIKYHINRMVLDFGVQAFNRPVTSKMLTLTNNGRVNISFELDLSPIKRKSSLQVGPTTGSVKSGEKQKFSLTMHPGIPDRIQEHFNLQVEYFQPHDLEVHVEGTYPNITVDANRVRGHKFLSFVEAAWNLVSESKRKGLLFPLKDSSTDSASDVASVTLERNRTRQSFQRHPSTCVMTCIHEGEGDTESHDHLASESSTSPSPDLLSDVGKNDVNAGEVAGQQALTEELLRREEELRMQPTLEEVDAEIDRLIMLQKFYVPVIDKEQSSTEEKPSEALAITQADSHTTAVILESDNKEKIKEASLEPVSSIMPVESKAKAKKDISVSPVAATKVTNLTVSTNLSDDHFHSQKSEMVTEAVPSLLPVAAMQEKQGVEIQKLVMNKYYMDFENVRLGFAKKLALRVTNVGVLPVSIKVDKTKAKGFGFSIEPDRVIHVQSGRPLPQTVELLITFNANQPKFPLGKLECWVPINVKEGPKTMVLLKANVTSPVLVVSTDVVDFGSIQVGRCKTIYVQFENRGEATCEWCAERPELGTVTMRVLRDWDFFSCIPNFGSIPPHDFMIVKILFVPKLQKFKTTYETTMPIRVSGIPAPVNITLKGHSYTVPLIFEPSDVELGPIMPNATTPYQTLVDLKNKSNQTIEVYSLDFDPQYIKEEEILREAQGYNEKQMLFVDIREAGEPFWSNLLDNSGEEESSPKGTGSEKENVADKSAKKLKEKKEEDSKSPKAKRPKQGKETNSVDHEHEVSPTGIRGPILMIFGPPLIGKSTQAEMLSLRYKITVVQIEKLILSAIRDKILTIPSQEAHAAKIDKKNKDGKVGKEKDNKKSGEDDSGTQKVKEKKEAGKKKDGKENKAKGGKADIKDKRDPEREVFEKEVLNVLKTRLQNPDCAQGVIFDGLSSAYIPPLSLIKRILETLGLKATQVNIPVPDSQLQDEDQKTEKEYENSDSKKTAKEHEQSDSKKTEKELQQSEGKKVEKDHGEAKKPEKKTIPMTIWKGGPTVNFINLRADQPELAAYYKELPETCHSVLKSEYGSGDDSAPEKLMPHPLCKHHLHFPALEGSYQPSELAPHLHLEKSTSYPYKSIYPSPEDIHAYFVTEIEVFAALGLFARVEEAIAIGQKVIISNITALQDCQAVFQEEMKSLPPPPSERPLPEPHVFQVIKKPPVRELLDISKFTYSIMTASSEVQPSSPRGETKKEKPVTKEKKPEKKGGDASGTGTTKKKQGAGKGDTTKNPHDIVPKGCTKKTRWLIPPKTSISLMVQFWSSEVGEFDHAFHFEVLGGLGHRASLFCTGICAYPQITVFYMKYPPRKHVPVLIGVTPKRIPTLVPIVDNQLDFGAISTGRTPDEFPDIPDGEHCKRLCIRNTGLFDLQVEFQLIKIAQSPEDSPDSRPATGGKKENQAKKAQETASPPATEGNKEKQSKKAQELEKDGKKNKPGKKGKKGDANQPVFSVHPKSMDLKIDESQVLSLSAFPREGLKGKIQEKLICKVKGNPEPLEFTAICVADSPLVELSTKVVDFQRLLIGRSKKMEFSIKNLCALKVKWSIPGIGNIPVEFHLSESAGFLRAGEEAIVAVIFSSISEQKYDQKLKVEVTHGRDHIEAPLEHQLRLLAEGYIMDVQIRFPEPELPDGIDYGTIKVGEEALRTIAVENKGKYKVGYKFNLTTALIRELVTITPLEGLLEPRANLKVAFCFNKDKTLRRETTLHRNRDITLDLIESLYEQTEKTIPIFISLHAVHAKFLILPAREIDFEYEVCSLLSQPRIMKILNTGVFDFNFRLNSSSAKGVESPSGHKAESVMTKKSAKTVASAKTSASTKTAVSAKGVKGNKEKGSAAPKMLDLRNFQLFPAMGSVAPGMKQDIQVYFKAPYTPSAVSEEITIAITDRDPLKYPEDIVYTLKGESQFPGTETDPEVIFEEHRMVDEFDLFPAVLPPRTYSKGDRLFSFGAVFIDTEPRSSTTQAESGKPSAEFPVDNLDLVRSPRKIRQFGADVNFKIKNTRKVPCTVEFTLTPEVVEQETLEAYEVPFAMEIKPQIIDIPPLDCRYIQCLFNPRSIRTYAALFEANVKNGGDDVKTKQFKCHLKGEGTLPHIHVESPAEISPSGAPWLKYPRTKVNQSIQLPLVLQNQGIVPAIANILVARGSVGWLQMSLQTDQMLYSPLPFSSSFTIRSKQRETILVTFTPLEAKHYECEIQVAVSSNPFNNLSIQISAEGYMEEVECLGLPRKLGDQLWFEDGPFGITKTFTFSLKNNCEGKHWRFTWPLIPFVQFLPATGHLRAGLSKQILAVFNPPEKVEYLDKEVRVPMYNILYAEEGDMIDWDSPVPDIQMLEADQAGVAKAHGDAKGKGTKGVGKGTAKTTETNRSAKGGPEKAGKAKSKGKEGTTTNVLEYITNTPGVEVEPEPHHEMVKDSSKTLVIRLHAVADMARYECDARSIHFKSTMMFQTRTFSFSLKNRSRVELLFNWRMQKQDNSLDESSLYSVTPQTGSVAADGFMVIIVKFSPTEVEDCTRVLLCEIPGLDPQWMPLSLPVTGHVTRPWCHFKLPKSDYITGKRRNQALVGPDGEVGPLDPEIKVIEITSIGINVQNFMTFTAINPTNLPYKFVWVPTHAPSQSWPEDDPPLQAAVDQLHQPFRCLSRCGEINEGEGYEMSFEFVPLKCELQERFWTFRIPSLDISVQFLLVGYVYKPKLHFDHAVVNFDKVQVGTKDKSYIRLINAEDTPFPFSFDKSTYLRTQSEQNPMKPVLLFSPSHGVADPNSETPIEISFAPMGEGPQNFNVVCNLKKALQLTVNVKGEGYTIHDKVFLEVLNDGIPLQLSCKDVNHIHLGDILINNMVFKRFVLTNTGIFPFHFVWRLGGYKKVIVEPPGGIVKGEEQIPCDLSFCPTSPGEITDVTVICQVRHSNQYILNISGNCYRPRAVFSFLNYDFGPTFLDAVERDPPTVELVVRNAGTSAITVENMYESTSYLDVPHTTLLLSEGEEEALILTFKPLEIRQYKEHVNFQVNGLDTVTVIITGEGVALQVELVDPSQKVLVFDSLKIGQFANIAVPIINRTRAHCDILWTPIRNRFMEFDMVCLPSDGLHLRGKQIGTLDLQFRPKSRIPPYKEPLVITAAGTEIVLATVSGCCVGTDVKLSTNFLAFGTVTLGSKLTRKIQVENCGDIGTAFAWDVCTHATECTLFPPEGYLAPHQVAVMEVSFHPSAVHPDIVIDRIHCAITGGETQFLTVTGACIEHDPPVETLTFVAPVRSTDTKTVELKNTTDHPWLLCPKIENKFWSGACTVEIPANQTVGYSITFHPITMSESGSHMGSVTFPLPDGSALYYKLAGDAGAPLPAGDIQYDVKARKKASIPLKVQNWLKTAQHFVVIIEQYLEDITSTITGPKAVEVPGHATRECLLQFHAHKPGTYGSKVTFRNEGTGEYIFYNLMVVANKADVIKVIPFESVVRQKVIHTLHIRNPLQILVTFSTKCDNPEVRVPGTLELDPGATATIDISFRPLLECQMVSYLTLTNELLGEMVYQLELRSYPPGFDDSLTFITPLGSRQTQMFRFMHYLPTKVAYKCELSEDGKEAGFIVPTTIGAEAADLDGQEVQVPIIFEPSKATEKSYGILSVIDPKAGSYTCRMLGTCGPPVPQGPVMVYGKGVINFRNVFDKAIQFTYVVDNPAFVCGKGEKIPSKKQTKIAINYKKVPGGSDRGRLTILSPEMPLHRWIFYLQGSDDPPPKIKSPPKSSSPKSKSPAKSKKK